MTNSTIGLFYGSSTCYTEMTAEKIQKVFGEDKLSLFNIADTPIEKTLDFDHLIFGIPTWDYGELQEDWEAIWDNIDELDLNGKTAAIYGQGDQIGYPEWFLDAMGYLHTKLINQGAKLIGYWPVEGYEFERSQALTEDETHFVGLALDDENEFEASQSRIETWCKLLEQDFRFK